MQPTQEMPYVPSVPSIPQRIRDVLVERRLPYRIQQFVDRAAWRVEKTVRRDGLRFRVRRQTSDELFVENVVVHKEYNPPGFEIRPGDVVVDIGANIGTFAVHTARIAARVISVEPNSENFRLLKENIRLNRSNVTAIRAAVCDFDGTVSLHCGTHGGYHSILDDRGGPAIEVVSALRLERIIQEHGINQCDFLKIDCEGAEYQIFNSLPADVFARIRKVAMEWHGPVNRDQRIAQACALVDRLKSHGFYIDRFTEFPGFRGGMIFAHHH